MGKARPIDVTVRTDGPTSVDSASRSALRPDERLFADGDTIVGRYLVEELLGQGGFGQVYRVRDGHTEGRQLALKLARLHDAGSQSLETLKSEFALLSSMNHPNLARVHDFGHIGEDIAYFTQTLAPGVPLNESRLRPDDPSAVPVWAQLCRALEYLHERGILHRDIKPSNVLVDLQASHLTLLDFGISRALGGADDFQLVGTWAYMPPEAISGGPLDARSDLYSLGVTLYRQVAGRVPFEGPASDVLNAHVARIPEPLPPSQVSLAVGRVIERLLCKEPGARFASAAEVLQALALANGVTLEAEPAASLASYVLSGRFAGQQAALEKIVKRSLSVDPAGPALLVMGEAGSGKSRLLREARQRVQLSWRPWIQVEVRRTWLAKGVLHTIGRAVIDEGVLRRLSDDDRRELARALPELRKRGERLGVAVDPERARQARIEALGRAIRLRFAETPGVLVVEDVHWSDPETLSLLVQLVRNARREKARCTFVFASRPGDLAQELRSALDAELIDCEALPPEVSKRLVESMFGRSDLLDGTELGKSLERSAHTAQYVQESLRLALDSGAIVRRESEWRLVEPLAALPLPAVLAQRVAHLSDGARRLAFAVAILGGETSGAEAAAVADMPAAPAGSALRALVRAGLLEERFDTQGRAAYGMHERFREIVLEDSPRDLAVRAHRAAARLLRTRAEGDHRVLLDAADHFARAGDKGLAARVASEASRAAERAGRPDQAVIAVEAEMRWRLERGQVPVSLWLRRFDLCLLAGLREAADDALRALQASVERATPAERVAIALRKARLALERGEPGVAHAEARPTVDLAQQIGDPKLLSELHWVLARADEIYGRLNRALEGFETAANYAQQAGRPDLEARAWLGASLSAIYLGTSGQAGTYAERALGASRSAADPVATAESLRCLGNAARESGDIQRALKVYRRAVRAARDGGSPESEAKALNNLGTVCHFVGLIPEAVAALQRSLVLKQRMGLTASALTTRNNLGSIFLSLGRFDEARAHFQSVIDSTVTREPMVVALAHSNSGDLCVLLGELDTAVELYRAAHRMNLERANAMADSHAVSGLLRALVMRDRPGDLEEARAHLETLRTLNDRSDLAECRSRYLTTSAVLFDRCARDDAALSAARRAMDIEQERRLRFSDPFGTVLEAQWIEAICLSRLGRAAAAQRAAARVRADLLKTAKHVGDEHAARTFLEANPLHRSIVAGRLDVARGWTWLPG